MKGEARNIYGTCSIVVAPDGRNVAYPMSALIRNLNVATVYLGHNGVTTSNGFPLRQNESITIDIVNEALFAVATVTTTVNILRRGD